MKVEEVEENGSVQLDVLDDAFEGVMACMVDDEATTTVSAFEARPTNG